MRCACFWEVKVILYEWCDKRRWFDCNWTPEVKYDRNEIDTNWFSFIRKQLIFLIRFTLPSLLFENISHGLIPEYNWLDIYYLLLSLWSFYVPRKSTLMVRSLFAEHNIYGATANYNYYRLRSVDTMGAVIIIIIIIIIIARMGDLMNGSSRWRRRLLVKCVKVVRRRPVWLVPGLLVLCDLIRNNCWCDYICRSFVINGPIKRMLRNWFRKRRKRNECFRKKELKQIGKKKIKK